VYGADERRPFREEQAQGRPLSPYGATKVAGEALAYAHYSTTELPVATDPVGHYLRHNSCRCSGSPQHVVGIVDLGLGRVADPSMDGDEPVMVMPPAH
jgi:hypothetical protein